MKSFSMTRVLFSGPLSIKSFLKDPYSVQFNNNFTIKTDSYLLISNPKVYGTGTTFTVTTKNRKKVRDTIEMVIHWFYDPGKKDMFFIDDNNEKQFNLDYQNLRMAVKNKNKNTSLVFSPCIVDGQYGPEEGVCMYINDPSNIVFLTLSDLKEVLSVIDEFNFQTESILLTQALDFHLKNKRVVNREQESIFRTIESTDRNTGSR